MTEPELADRIDRIESALAIQQLAVRYAMAVDARDIDGWLVLFVEDVDGGRNGKGRDALRQFIVPAVRKFYRTIHYVAGHRIDFTDAYHATGQVYCRAEHEDGDKWVVMGICYFDDYERRDGNWFFVRRRERHWYAADVLEQPMSPAMPVWPAEGGIPATLPLKLSHWSAFWAEVDPSDVQKVTRHPV